jgi:hypothetical protein
MAAHDHIGINGLDRESLDRIGRLTNEDLRLAEGDRNETRVRAIQLDLHRSTRSDLDITAGRHAHREAANREIGGR